MKILFVVELKHSAFKPSADVKTKSRYQVQAMSWQSMLALFTCVRFNLYELSAISRLQMYHAYLWFAPFNFDTENLMIIRGLSRQSNNTLSRISEYFLLPLLLLLLLLILLLLLLEMIYESFARWRFSLKVKLSWTDVIHLRKNISNL